MSCSTRDAGTLTQAVAAATFRATEKVRSLPSFHDFGLAEPLTRALAEENYAAPTPIQTQTIPVALARRDAGQEMHFVSSAVVLGV